MRLVPLIAMMAVVVMVSGGVSMYLLYDTAIDAQQAQLHDAAKNHARLIEAVARHAAAQPMGPGETAAANTLAQVIDAHERSEGFGSTGEYVLAQRRGDKIVFMLSQRYGQEAKRRPDPLPRDGPLGTPMRRALRRESGAFMGVDYRGATVVAGYEPVAELDMGLVAKIDLAEVRAPFVRAAFYGGAVALMAILLSAFLFVRATTPLIHRIRETEAYNRTIVESAADGIMTVDERGRITSFNRACVDMFGYPEDAALGRDVVELLPDFDATRHRRAAAATGLRADGTKALLEVTVSGLAGRVPGRLSLFIRDVSERRRLEAELRHAQKMEAVGTLASGIAHDFNNLMMGIVSSSEVALKKCHDGQLAQHLEQIKATAVSGASITRQLLTFGRPGDAPTSSIDLNEVVADAEQMLRHLLDGVVELRITLFPGAAPILGGRGELEQILLNLVGNARHAMPSGGELSIAVSSVELEAGEFMLLTVSDTGDGMTEETKNRVFEPFFTTKGDGSGTGLGLSSVYGIVDRHGGHVEVDSTVGVGTTFRIYWPAAGAVRADDDPRSPLLGELGGSETVLLVEDEPLVRLSVREYLERSGYRVLEASSVESAMELAGEHGPNIDLLLTDMGLKGKSGAHLASLLDVIPVLFMSAHPTELLVRDGKLAPGTTSLQKPFTEQELLRLMREVLAPATVEEEPMAPNERYADS